MTTTQYSTVTLIRERDQHTPEQLLTGALSTAKRAPNAVVSSSLLVYFLTGRTSWQVFKLHVHVLTI